MPPPKDQERSVDAAFCAATSTAAVAANMTSPQAQNAHLMVETILPSSSSSSTVVDVSNVDR
jgi:hypothetical protein